LYLNLLEAVMGDIDLGLPELLGSQWTTIALILVVVILLLVFLLLRMRGNRKRAALEQAVQAGVSGKGKKGKAPKEPKQPKAKKSKKAAAVTDVFPDQGAALVSSAGGGFLSQGADGAPGMARAEAASMEPTQTPGMTPAETPGLAPGEVPSDVLGEIAGEVPVETAVATSKGKGKTPKAPAPSPYANLSRGDLPATDPLRSVLNSVLQGWGDLTTEDTNRLKLFRTDKVLDAIAAIELPKDLKNSEHARSRLNQLRHYANSLQKGDGTPSGPLAEFAGIGLGPIGQAQTPGAAAAGTGVAGITETDEATGTAETAEAQTAETLESAGTAEASGETEAPEAESAEDYSEEESAGEGRAADASWGVTSSGKELWGTPAAVALWGAPEAPEDTLTESPAAPGAEPAPAQIAWEPGGEEKAEEKPSTSPSGGGDTEATVAAAAAAFWAATDTPQTEESQEEVELPVVEVEEMIVEEELPVVEEMTGFEEVSGFETATGDGLAGAAGTIAGAGDLLALSTEEQLAKLGALEPEDLTKVFRATNDTRLKKSIIDTLEHKGFLDTIHEFFDDPDPEVQTHALDAADRLLGSE